MSKHKSTPTAAEFMTRNVYTVFPDTALADVIQILLKHEISNVPVIQNQAGKQVLAGFISERDCLASLADESYFGSPSPPQTARTVMRLHPVCVAPETELFTLASIFVNHGFRHLPVVESGGLVGIVSRRDILRAMDENYRENQQEQSRKKSSRPDLREITNYRFIMGDQ